MGFETWLSVAKELPEGRSTRMQCCKHDRSMLVSNTSRGYSAYCFRCGFREFESHGERSISQVSRTIAERGFEQARHIRLPDDYVSIYEATEQAQAWLLKYGISLELAYEYQIGYSLKMDRVILPCFSDDGKVLLHVQARALDGRKPKYLNQSSPISSVLYWSQGQVQGDYITIVEDILSCIKVGQVSPAVCLLGTNITAIKAAKIAARYDAVLIWTDDDDAGERCRDQAKKQLELQGVQMIHNMCTTCDPKCCTYADIQEMLNGVQWK